MIKQIILVILSFLLIAGFIVICAIDIIDEIKPKEQLYHRVVEQDIVGPDTIENIYFVPDSVWYKTH